MSKRKQIRKTNHLVPRAGSKIRKKKERKAQLFSKCIPETLISELCAWKGGVSGNLVSRVLLEAPGTLDKIAIILRWLRCLHSCQLNT